MVMDKELLKLTIGNAFSQLFELSKEEEGIPLGIRAGLAYRYEPDLSTRQIQEGKIPFEKILTRTRLYMKSVISPVTEDRYFKLNIHTDQRIGEPLVITVSYLYTEYTGVNRIPIQHGAELVKDIDISPEQVAHFAESLQDLTEYESEKLIMSKDAIDFFKQISKAYIDLADLIQESAAQEQAELA